MKHKFIWIEHHDKIDIQNSDQFQAYYFLNVWCFKNKISHVIRL